MKKVFLLIALASNLLVLNAQKKDFCQKEKSIFDLEIVHFPGIQGNEHNPSEKGGNEINFTVISTSKNLNFVSNLKHVSFGSHVYNGFGDISDHEKMSFNVGFGIRKKIGKFFGETTFAPLLGGYWQDGFEPENKKHIEDQKLVLSKGFLIRNEFFEFVLRSFKKEVEIDGHLDLPEKWQCVKNFSGGINFGTINGVRFIYSLKKWKIRILGGVSHSNPVLGVGFEFSAK